MDTASQILLIIVSSVLTIFLIVGIVLLVAVIRLIKGVRRVADKAESLVTSAEAATEMLRKTAGPIALGRFLSNISEVVLRQHKKK